ncbi:hypothetical protein V502_00993 [Pseudogymnoascus sp. VKM F-4520 (FW-2644)]|nr:hypothetical protein V502_00993 [Pseudogymnoascus sp. VKM F-4520 (FW-2644)]
MSHLREDEINDIELHHDATSGIVLHTSAKHHGISLWPPPSNDPYDPLRWPRWLKILALFTTALCNFTGNFAAAGPSVATQLFEAQFIKSASQVNGLMTFNFLFLGIGNMIWVPIAVKVGKRAVLITSMALLFAALCWSASATTFNSLLAGRCVTGFAAAAGESIVPGIVSDLFFIHEHGAMMSIYVVLISSATALGPLIASYMVQYSLGTWRDFVWLSAALAGFNLILLILFYPESNFRRPPLPTKFRHHLEESQKAANDYSNDNSEGKSTESRVEHSLSIVDPNDVQHVKHIKVPWHSIWFSFIKVDHSVNFLKAFLHPLVFLVYPPVVWAIFVYGAALSSQVILTFAFPSLLLAPPYLFSPSSVGLMQIAALIGFIIACYVGGYVSDVITTKRILREGGVIYPEQRLLSVIPGALIPPVGCIIIACACSQQLHWAVIAVGFGMVSFGTVYAPNIAIAYVIGCYPDQASQCLILINVVKNLVAFIFLYVAVDWVERSGWFQVYMIMFMLVSLTMVAAIPLWFYGAASRRFTSGLKVQKWF